MPSMFGTNICSGFGHSQVLLKSIFIHFDRNYNTIYTQCSPFQGTTMFGTQQYYVHDESHVQYIVANRLREMTA